MKIRFIYRLSSDAMYREFLTGECGAEERAVVFDLKELSVQARRNVLALSNIAKMPNSPDRLMDQIWYDGKPIECVRVWLMEKLPWEDSLVIMTLDHAITTRDEVEHRLSDMMGEFRKTFLYACAVDLMNSVVVDEDQTGL